MATILIVEDDTFVLSLMAQKLQKGGFDVISAVKGDEGLAKARTEHPTLVLLDLLLPDMSGYDVLEKLKEDPDTADIPVVIFSNLGREEDIKRGKELGAEAFLVKAYFSLDDLVKKVQKVLAGEEVEE